jgi:hypothetical protein
MKNKTKIVGYTGKYTNKNIVILSRKILGKFLFLRKKIFNKVFTDMIGSIFLLNGNGEMQTAKKYI